MVINPHILFIGTTEYLQPLSDLLADKGAKTIIGEEHSTLSESKSQISLEMMGMIEDAYRTLGYIDTLVFCDQVRIDEKEYPHPDEIIRQTSYAVSRLLISVRCLALKMIESDSPGQIIVICDTSAVAGRHNSWISSTVGGALIGMCKSLAKELGRYRIAVNIICLGAIEGVDVPNRFTAAETRILKASGLGKLVNVTHLLNNIFHLASGEHWLNGQILHVNDGLVM
ncbi:SDR family NAD(P)-dependent oxidoreductase [Nitrosomonas sp.]|uniref:SDR family NAD(P)-dependent oxidoreductase n=1 Tax=Nitrosomonas sp. TaxID=42353 RepID=UPI001DB9E2EF|nr:SDR family oxidoreductase [Nitrosomonas sp.]MBX3617756.1 SDR family oxidoreductase [Nitrosomonas sp.]